MKDYYSLSEVADLLGKSKETLRRWDNNGKLTAVREPMSNYRVYRKEQLKIFDELDFLFNSTENGNQVIPDYNYSVIELFAGAGGLGIGLEKAGLKCVALNEIDHWAAETLRQNRPHWKVFEDDIRNLSFSAYKGKVDVVTGGFPCQAFSYAGKKLGLEDARGTLFYEFARIVTEKFQKELKRLLKKYKSLKEEYAQLINTLQNNPKLGTSIGQNCYKIRIAIKSKGTGKSGGARIITNVYIEGTTVYLLTIYDKSEQENITDKDLKQLLALIEK